MSLPQPNACETRSGRLAGSPLEAPNVASRRIGAFVDWLTEFKRPVTKPWKAVRWIGPESTKVRACDFSCHRLRGERGIRHPDCQQSRRSESDFCRDARLIHTNGGFAPMARATRFPQAKAREATRPAGSDIGANDRNTTPQSASLTARSGILRRPYNCRKISCERFRVPESWS